MIADPSVLCIKLHSIAGGLENLTMPSEEEKRKAYETARQLPVSADGKKWRLGEQDFEALMKHLDNVVCYLLHVSMSSLSSVVLDLGCSLFYSSIMAPRWVQTWRVQITWDSLLAASSA